MTSRPLEGRCVLITGGSRGIGAAIGREVAEQGGRVALLARDEAGLQAVAKEIEALSGEPAVFVPCDLSNEEGISRSVEAAIREMGGLHGVVNNAGINVPMRPFLEISREEFRYLLEVNFFGAAEVLRATLPHLVDQSDGAIVNIASMAGKMGVPTWSAYCSSKHALLGMTKVVAQEVALDGVTCNAVCPGFVDNDMASKAQLEVWAAEMGTTRRELVKEVIIKRTPQMRYVEETSVASMATYLLSDRARDITAQAINVSCGVGDY